MRSTKFTTLLIAQFLVSQIAAPTMGWSLTATKDSVKMTHYNWIKGNYTTDYEDACKDIPENSAPAGKQYVTDVTTMNSQRKAQCDAAKTVHDGLIVNSTLAGAYTAVAAVCLTSCIVEKTPGAVVAPALKSACIFSDLGVTAVDLGLTMGFTQKIQSTVNTIATAAGTLKTTMMTSKFMSGGFKAAKAGDQGGRQESCVAAALAGISAGLKYATWPDFNKQIAASFENAKKIGGETTDIPKATLEDAPLDPMLSSTGAGNRAAAYKNPGRNFKGTEGGDKPCTVTGAAKSHPGNSSAAQACAQAVAGLPKGLKNVLDAGHKAGLDLAKIENNVANGMSPGQALSDAIGGEGGAKLGAMLDGATKEAIAAAASESGTKYGSFGGGSGGGGGGGGSEGMAMPDLSALLEQPKEEEPEGAVEEANFFKELDEMPADEIAKDPRIGIFFRISARYQKAFTKGQIQQMTYSLPHNQTQLGVEGGVNPMRHPAAAPGISTKKQ